MGVSPISPNIKQQAGERKLPGLFCVPTTIIDKTPIQVILKKIAPSKNP